MAVASSTAALLGAAVTLASTAVGTWSAVSRQETGGILRRHGPAQCAGGGRECPHG